MIDILMSTYNGARYLEEQIDSILAQTHRDFRLLIRDDGSTDASLKIIEKYQSSDERIERIEDGAGNLGASASFMKLIERSSAPYFMLADQDDVWLPEKVAKSFEQLLKMEKLYGLDAPLLVFTDLIVTDENLNRRASSFWRYQRLDPEISQNWKKLLAQNVVTGCTILANEKVREIVLPYVLEEMMHDHWIAVNVAKYGKIDYLNHFDERTVLYRQHSKNVEGAKNFGARYAAGKIPRIFGLINFYRRAARIFGGVSAAEILFHKISLNLKRLKSYFYRRGSVKLKREP